MGAEAVLKGKDSDRWKALEKESTVELIRRIVEDSDRLALDVFLETRKLFCLKGEWLFLPDFLFRLREILLLHESPELADCTYDLTLAKYSNFPDEPGSQSSPGDYTFMGRGVDCRNYYRAFLEKISKIQDEVRYSSQLEEEKHAGQVLQKLVWGNFRLSKRECNRRSPFSVRYQCKIEGVRFDLWYPSYMKAREFREWLEGRMKDIDPSLGDEQERIQNLINEELGRGYHISLDDPDVARTFGTEEGPSSIRLHEGARFGGGLAKRVAEEKVDNIDTLRPSIRKLGKGTVSRLIFQIFEELVHGEFEDGRIASEYGISKATFSRFAGSKWHERIEGSESPQIPDLWRNTAKILAGNRGRDNVSPGAIF